jgi:hypothetical protein
MIINRENNFVFIHIPKTGGSSFCNSYLDFMGLNTRREGRGWQSPAYENGIMHSMYREKEAIINNMFVTCVVRNPFDRWVSCYGSMLREKRNHFSNPEAIYIHHLALDSSFEKWVNTLIDEHSMWNTVFIRPQTEFIKNYAGVIDINLIGRCEEYSKFIEDVNNLTNLKVKESLKNTSKHKPYQEYYTESLVKLVQDWNKEDFDNFEYKNTL